MIYAVILWRNGGVAYSWVGLTIDAANQLLATVRRWPDTYPGCTPGLYRLEDVTP